MSKVKSLFSYLLDSNAYDTQKAIKVLEKTDNLLRKIFKYLIIICLVIFAILLVVSVFGGMLGNIGNLFEILFYGVVLVISLVVSLLIYRLTILAVGALFRLVELNENSAGYMRPVKGNEEVIK